MNAKTHLASIALVMVGVLLVAVAAFTAVMSVESSATASAQPQAAVASSTEGALSGLFAAGGGGNR